MYGFIRMENEKCKCKKICAFWWKGFIGQVWDYISDPTNIVKHGFYPFIHYEKKFNKFTRKDGIKENLGTYVILHTLIDIYILIMGIFWIKSIINT